MISCHLNWCLLTTEKTESKPCRVIISRASFRWNGFRHGAVAWILHTTTTSADKEDIFVNQLLLLLSTFLSDLFTKLDILLRHPSVVGIPGCSRTNSWMVSKDVDESLETSGLLRWTLAPQAMATFSISLWSVDTHTLQKGNVQLCHVYTFSSVCILFHFTKSAPGVSCDWRTRRIRLK